MYKQYVLLIIGNVQQKLICEEESYIEECYLPAAAFREAVLVLV